MAKKISIVCLPGDGVGPEVVGEAVKVLQKVAEHRAQALNVEFEFKNELIGLAALEKTGKEINLRKRIKKSEWGRRQW